MKEVAQMSIVNTLQGIQLAATWNLLFAMAWRTVVEKRKWADGSLELLHSTVFPCFSYPS